jgi:hypothetical protein
MQGQVLWQNHAVVQIANSVENTVWYLRRVKAMFSHFLIYLVKPFAGFFGLQL